MAPSDRDPLGPPAPSHARLFDLLADIDRQLREVYGPEWEFEIVGRAAGRRPIRLLCPRPRPAPEDDSLAGEILKAIEEAGDPSTVREIAYAVHRGAPSGALKRALRRLVEAGKVRELDSTPRTYDLR